MISVSTRGFLAPVSLSLSLLATAAAGGNFVTFESGQVRPLALSPDGSRLFAVDTTTSVVYPAGDLGAALKDAAALIRGNIGVRVIAISIGGWDTHTNLVAQLGGLGTQLAGCLKAFHDDLGADLGRTLTLVMTEFGRRVDQNGGGGTDHGHGGVMMAMGGGIAGGRVILRDGTWPGLAPADRFIGEDLQVTTDFRDVFAEALNRHMGLAVSSMGPVFPGFSASATRFPGLYA